MFGWFRRKKDDSLPKHLRTGIWGEKEAEIWLKDKGLKVLGRRVRVGKKDELDLLVKDGDCLVFVEVKTRASEAFGRAASAVDRNKRYRMSRAAVRYLTKVRERPGYIRFDVVEVIGTLEDGAQEIRHIRNAFNLHPKFRLPW